MKGRFFMLEKITGNLVLPRRTAYGTLSVEDGVIASVEEQGPFRPDSDVVVPGFVDIHFHGTGPYGTLTDEDINGIASFEPSNGVTAFTPVGRLRKGYASGFPRKRPRTRPQSPAGECHLRGFPSGRAVARLRTSRRHGR